MSSSKTVSVDLGHRAYDIRIGSNLLTDAGALIKPHIAGGRVCIVTDETVHKLHYAALKAGLEKAGIEPHLIIRPPGEAEKCFASLESIIDSLLSFGFDRNDTLIAFGGGVIGDLTGFAASIFKRGCRFIQIPTTLLAQVDSSVGGKTAINTAHGKNLVGAFYQPQLVLTDTSVLSTLPEREMKAGYAEVLKYGLLGKAKFFKWLEAHGRDVLAGDADALAEAIAVSCRTKADIVAMDEREHGVRALLNLGHTFGHALEAEAGYSHTLLHGEAVSAGMLMAFEYSVREDLCGEEDLDRVAAHIMSLGLAVPEDVPQLLRNPAQILSHMDQDKKNRSGKLTLILVRGIGKAFEQKEASRENVLKYLTALSEKASRNV